MEANHIDYDFNKSLQRIDEILDASSDSYQEKESIPSRSLLTYTNGFYVNCTAIFVDICDSSNLTKEHNRPVLGKIYRSFISELVALFSGNSKCKEVNINGDCVWAVFETPYQTDVDAAFCAACQAGSLVDVLNYKLNKKGYTTYKVGIGIDYGRALMIKAGYKGSGINDVIWMGDVVNYACHLSAEGSKYGNDRIQLSQVIYDNLCDDNKKLCTSHLFSYSSSAVNIELNNWLKEQRSKNRPNYW